MAKKLNFTYVDWLKIVFKLFMGLGTLAIIWYSWINGLINLNIHRNPNGAIDPNYYNYWQQNGNIYSAYVYSFFTIQSNLLCIFMWLSAGLLHKYEGRVFWLKDNWVKAITIYITTTGLIYCCVLLPLGQPNTPYLWFQDMWYHALVPVTFVLYYLFLYQGHIAHQAYKKFYMKNVPLILIYFIAYFVFSMTRSYLILQKWKSSGIDWSNKTVFNYFFLNVTKNSLGLPGYVWTIIVVVVILGIIFGLGSLYTFANNKIYSLKTNSQHQNVKKSKKIAVKNKKT